ncbi:MAG TPA: hypothetical protein VGJ20_01680 [Xanthobacteraceae bacterium]|jgi:hypothetical protein
MLPLLSLHAIAEQRGDGLHPELLAGLRRLAAEHGKGVAAEARGKQEGQSAEPAEDGAMREELRADANPHDNLARLR